MAETEMEEAALELSILSVDIDLSKKGTSATSLPWWKPNRYYAVAWLDHHAKQSTGTLNPGRKRKLYFPLSPSTLQDPSAASVTVQIFSSSRLLPFHGGKLVGIAVLPFSSVRLSAETFALPLRRPSCRVLGSIRISARILWDLGFRPPVAAPVLSDCPVDAWVDHPSAPVAGAVDPTVTGNCGIDPSTPELGDFSDSMTPSDEIRGSIEPTAPPEPEQVEANALPWPEARDEQGISLIGLIGGTFLAAVVGLVCIRSKVKPFAAIGW